MSKFTQGPWIFDDEYIFTAYRGMMIADVMAVREKEFNANGRLIAAAPEMYALLENTAFYLQGLSKMYSLSGVFDYVSLIKELLARIDGEGRDNND